MESGILDERRLPFNDDGRAAFSDDFVLAVSVFGNFLSLGKFSHREHGVHREFFK